MQRALAVCLTTNLVYSINQAPEAMDICLFVGLFAVETDLDWTTPWFVDRAVAVHTALCTAVNIGPLPLQHVANFGNELLAREQLRFNDPRMRYRIGMARLRHGIYSLVQSQFQTDSLTVRLGAVMLQSALGRRGDVYADRKVKETTCLRYEDIDMEFHVDHNGRVRGGAWVSALQDKGHKKYAHIPCHLPRLNPG